MLLLFITLTSQEHVGALFHPPIDCLFKVFVTPTTNPQSKLSIIWLLALCAGNLPVTDGFPHKGASNVETVSMSWRHHVLSLLHTHPIAKFMGQHGAHLGPVGPRWAPCWPNEPCYQGTFHSIYGTPYNETRNHDPFVCHPRMWQLSAHPLCSYNVSGTYTSSSAPSWWLALNHCHHLDVLSVSINLRSGVKAFQHSLLSVFRW